MIKLTEILQNAGSYNPERGLVDSSYEVREIFINPKFVVCMVENEALSSIHSKSPIINELSPEAKFTRLTLASGVNGVVFHNVLGTPKQHIKNITKKTT